MSELTYTTKTIHQQQSTVKPIPNIVHTSCTCFSLDLYLARVINNLLGQEFYLPDASIAITPMKSFIFLYFCQGRLLSAGSLRMQNKYLSGCVIITNYALNMTLQF